MKPKFFFDFPCDDGSRRPLAFGVPREVLCANELAEVRGVLQVAEARALAGAWVVGMVAYEAAPAFDVALKVRGDGGVPLAWFAVFDEPLTEAAAAPNTAQPPISWQPSIDRRRFDADIAAIRRAIGDGETYQVNHTLRLHGRYDGDGLGLFERLRSAQPNSYAAYLDMGRWSVLSVSPELFFRRDGGTLTTRPMKGTVRRGRWPAEDAQLADWLHASEKNRAENLMIVDLLRNDLSRVAMPHSVRVPALFSVERYPTVLQMTSTVTAEARPGVALVDIFAALFPCGSVTGAPKAKSMEIITERETEPRGAYCGAIGLLKPGGDAVFNVAIRSVTLDNDGGTATCGVGGGIVWDSTAGDEYAEALLKSRFLSPDATEFDLLETLRLENGRYPRLDLHMARLAASAQHFCRPFDESLCRQRLVTQAVAAGEQAMRVRVRLDRAGAIEITSAPAPSQATGLSHFALAGEPVSRDSVWLYHKTTRREIYERAAAAHPGAFDVLLRNEEGEITEFTRGNVVLEIDGCQLTPRLDCGLLDGCLRRELLDRGEIFEAVLTLGDLRRARRIWFINSLRGRVELRRPAIAPATSMSAEMAAG
jgi:para-aminobenzoate synthetase/4-amino-4-deoxychorismate lyase